MRANKITKTKVLENILIVFLIVLQEFERFAGGGLKPCVCVNKDKDNLKN